MPVICQLLGVFPRKGRVNLVLELCETDLEVVLRRCNGLLEPCKVKCIMRMLLDGLAYCHQQNVVHQVRFGWLFSRHLPPRQHSPSPLLLPSLDQDVKPGNLLFREDGVLKLTDFGLAVHLSTPDEFLFHQVVTLRWRAPELLMGCRTHGVGVDLWAVGCVFAELLCGAPLFDEASELGMLVRIVKVLGSPSIATWPVWGRSQLTSASRVCCTDRCGHNAYDLCPADVCVCVCVCVLCMCMCVCVCTWSLPGTCANPLSTGIRRDGRNSTCTVVTGRDNRRPGSAIKVGAHRVSCLVAALPKTDTLPPSRRHPAVKIMRLLRQIPGVQPRCTDTSTGGIAMPSYLALTASPFPTPC